MRDVGTTDEKELIRSGVYARMHVPVFMSVCMNVCDVVLPTSRGWSHRYGVRE